MLRRAIGGYSPRSTRDSNKACPVTFSALSERSRSRLATVLAGAVLLLLPAASPVFAQQGEPPAQAQPPGAPAPAAAHAAELPDRISRLEQQVADLQTMVVALESLAKA